MKPTSREVPAQGRSWVTQPAAVPQSSKGLTFGLEMTDFG